jgi:hypothetical protein
MVFGHLYITCLIQYIIRHLSYSYVTFLMPKLFLKNACPSSRHDCSHIRIFLRLFQCSFTYFLKEIIVNIQQREIVLLCSYACNHRNSIYYRNQGTSYVVYVTAVTSSPAVPYKKMVKKSKV